MAFIQYVVTEGERWDTIAQKCYADVNMMASIIRDNPGVPITEKLKGGTILKILIIAKKSTEAAKILPPWK